MKTRYFLACAILAVFCLVTQKTSATVYDLVNQGIAPATATGTITTDGMLGVLSQSDITALNITVDDGAHSFILTLPDLLFSGSDLSATASGLFFNYAAVDGGFFAGVTFLLYPHGHEMPFAYERPFCARSSHTANSNARVLMRDVAIAP
jgi:hypothetical protein